MKNDSENFSSFFSPPTSLRRDDKELFTINIPNIGEGKMFMLSRIRIRAARRVGGLSKDGVEIYGESPKNFVPNIFQLITSLSFTHLLVSLKRH